MNKNTSTELIPYYSNYICIGTCMCHSPGDLAPYGGWDLFQQTCKSNYLLLLSADVYKRILFRKEGSIYTIMYFN